MAGEEAYASIIFGADGILGIHRVSDTVLFYDLSVFSYLCNMHHIADSD